MERTVSIIIPNYNCSIWLERTIESCLAFKDFITEIIIIDDFSTDDSWIKLQKLQNKFPQIIKIFKNLVKGANNARNYGFSLSSGDYIQWLDADDQLLGNKLGQQLKCFEETTDIVYSDWKLDTYENGALVRTEFKKNKQYTDFLYQILKDNWSTPHCYLLKREIAQRLHDVNAWNPETIVLQDREYFTIAAIMGAKFHYTPGCFAVYNRWNRNSVSLQAAKAIRYSNLEKLFLRFEKAIENETWISGSRKKLYYHTIDTQRILADVAGYPLKSTRKVGLGSVNWSLMPGVRTTLKLIRKILLPDNTRS